MSGRAEGEQNRGVDVGLMGEEMERAGETVLAAMWFERAGRQAQAAWQTERAIDYYQRALRLLGEDAVYASRRVDIFDGLGLMWLAQGKDGEAMIAYAGMREAAILMGDRRDEARALNGMAMAGGGLGNFAEALRQAEQAEELAQAAGAQHEVAAALLRQGLAHFGLGHKATARELAERAVALNSVLTAWDEAGHCFAALARIQGDGAEAEQFASSAVTAYRVAGDKWGMVMVLKYLGDIVAGRASQTNRYYEEARSIALEIGNGAMAQALGEKDEWRSDLARRGAARHKKARNGGHPFLALLSNLAGGEVELPGCERAESSSFDSFPRREADRAGDLFAAGSSLMSI